MPHHMVLVLHVLSHQINGHFRPVAFASCTLTQAQQNYSQLEKEAFSIIFGLKRFRQYLCGRSFTILTDHRPLLSLFGPNNPVAVHAAARLRRWALILASYDNKIEYRNTTAHADADSMSRLPLPQTWSPKCENVECYFLETEVVTNVTCQMIKKETQVDPILSQVYDFITMGWPNVVDPSLAPFKNKQNELSTLQGCILWGTRVVVPSVLQERVLQELHDTHPGMCRMKALARSFVWWPSIDSDIEKTVSSCHTCQSMRSAPPTAQIHPWIFPTRPWSRVHVDFAGPVGGNTYLVIVDAYSKFPEVVKMKNTTGNTTVTVLRDIFSRYGLPEILVSDNGPQFTSKEFEQFCTKNGIKHRTSAAYKPSTNGQAERVVQILKQAIKQAQTTKSDVASVIAHYLLVYRNTPHSTTGEPPSVLLMGRRLRTRLGLLKPSVEKHVEERQFSSMVRRTATRGFRQFCEGDRVLTRNYGRGDKWLTGVVSSVLGSHHYLIEVSGNLWKRHIDQLLSCPGNDLPHSSDTGTPATQSSSAPIEITKISDLSSTNLPAPTVSQEQPQVSENSQNTTPESMEKESISSVSRDPGSLSKDSAPSNVLVNPGLVCEDSAPTVERYPTRANRVVPRYLKDYELK